MDRGVPRRAREWPPTNARVRGNGRRHAGADPGADADTPADTDAATPDSDARADAHPARRHASSHSATDASSHRGSPYHAPPVGRDPRADVDHRRDAGRVRRLDTIAEYGYQR